MVRLNANWKAIDGRRIWSSPPNPLLTLCCQLTVVNERAEQRQRSKFNFPCSSQRGLQTENCFYAAAAAAAAAPLLCCWTARIWRRTWRTWNWSSAVVKHKTPNTKATKTEKNPAQSGGQTKLSSTLRCYNTFNALRQILQNFTKISFNVFGNICRY